MEHIEKQPVNEEEEKSIPSSDSLPASHAGANSKHGEHSKEKDKEKDKEANSRLTVRDLSVFFRNNPAIQNVSLNFRRHKVTAIIGPSGCGKSTLLRSLNRMHDITPGAKVTGEILLDGSDISKMDSVLVRKKIGMVFQRPNPFPSMSIFENTVAGLKLNGIHKKNMLMEVAEESLKGAALWDEVKDRLKHPANGLSGGQQQRLCIARALAVAPEILLMDEPCSALDPIATAKVEELMESIKAKLTVVIVTHNMQQAARVSDDTAFMYMGKLVEIGKTSDIFTHPVMKQTEDYITGRFG